MPNRPFNFAFLDAQIEKSYQLEIKFRQVFGVFFVLAISVACMGLFALAAYTAEQRTKEIGIRKVLGASVSNIAYLFSKDFLKLVVAANLIAWPIAYHTMDGWLQNFVYRIDLSIWPFLLGGVLILAIALATVGYQAVKVATAHPIDSLRYE